MRLLSLQDVTRRPRHVAVGEFDGVHVGHRQVIRGADTVLTFDPHPRTILSPDGAPPLLTSLSVKADRIAELGVAELVIVPFDRARATQSADSFVSEVLVGALGAEQVSVGENFRFGHLALGDERLLRARPEFTTRVSPLVEVDGHSVSSSALRRLVAAGDVDTANPLLGAPYELRGPVVHGDHRGRELGFPTANLVPDPALQCPANGVYACLAGVPRPDGGTDWHPAATSVGVRPTFTSDRGVLIEAHLLDMHADLYGTQLSLRFLHHLRGEIRYTGPEALIAQIELDVERTRMLAAEPLLRLQQAR